jgi:peptidoglycan hydrolase-like protein with peptidoglycan-binding domain/3D (Asp-Asp-Asp) domain-containing protein
MRTQKLLALLSLSVLLGSTPLSLAGGMVHLDLGLEIPEVQALEPTSGEALLAACQNGTLTEGVRMEHVITGYYSPLRPSSDVGDAAGQDYYVMGSWEQEIRMQGRGTNGASGKEVYYGMLAAPSTYPFGTKICFEDLGWMLTVDDRGGAINGNRLDVWTGPDETGLSIALGVGKRSVTGINLGINPDIPNYVNFDSMPRADVTRLYPAYYSDPNNAINSEAYNYTNVQNNTLNNTPTYVAPSLTFNRNLYYGESGEEVKKMQEMLASWGYILDATGFFGESTLKVLTEFQVDSGVIDNSVAFGSGNFGPSTRQSFEKYLKDESAVKDLFFSKGEVSLSKYADLQETSLPLNRALTIGDSGSDVEALQQVLTDLGYIRSGITGSFDLVTQNAVMRYQLKEGLIDSKSDPAAGYVGPTTRAYLNFILEERYDFKVQVAAMRTMLDAQGEEVMIAEEVTGVIPKNT